MLSKSVALYIFLTFTYQPLYTQDAKICGNFTTVDLNFDGEAYRQFEETFYQSLENRGPDDFPVIPVRAHILRTDEGKEGLENAGQILENEIIKANQYLSPSGISLELCGINYIDSSKYEKLTTYEVNSLTQNNNYPGVLNLYLPSRYWGFILFIIPQPLCGSASFPWSSQDYIVIDKDCLIENGVFIHELGHYFGLYHTHETAFGQELVDGSNCSTAGDKLCDTPADPELSISNTINCQYSGTATDINNQYYMPDVRNYMSYAPRQCTDRFSMDQYTRMAYYAETARNYFQVDRPDLTMVSMEDEPVQVLANEAFEIQVSLVGQTEVEATSIDISWYLLPEDDNVESQSFLGSTNIGNLAGLGSETVSIPLQIETVNLGRHHFRVCADADNEIAECSETNNCVTIDVDFKSQLQDTSPDILAFPNPTNNSTTIYYQSNNYGHLSVLLHNSQGQLLQRRIFQKNRNMMEFDYDFSQVPAGLYFLVLQVDNDRKVVKVVKM